MAARKAKSAFDYFRDENFEAIKGSTDGKVSDVFAEIGTQWKALSAEDKAKYEELAAEDRARFDRESEALDEAAAAALAERRAASEADPEKRLRVRDEQVPEQRKRAAPKMSASRRAALDAQAQERAAKKEEIEAKLSVLRKEQSDIFQHFLKNSQEGEDAPPSQSTPATKRTTSRTSLTSPHRLDHSARDGTDDKDLAEDATASVTRLSTQPPSIEFGTMRDYQLEGLNWMIGLHANGLNGILADEMGLGKTLQTISLLAYCLDFEELRGPHIVLAPKSTLSNWLNEFTRWCPNLRPLVFHGTKAERQEMKDNRLRPDLTLEERGWDVIITSYEIAIRERNVLSKFAWQYLVIDEAHRLKNENSVLAQVLREFVVAHRLLLTGTPLQNNLHELWALLNFLLPDVFYSSEAFDSWFDLHETDGKNNQLKIQQLHRLLRPFMLRRLKSEVAKSLPPKKETFLYVRMTPVQKDVYKNILRRDFDAIAGQHTERNRLLNIIMQLRKVCAHPYLFEGVEDRSLDPFGDHLITNCAKFRLLSKLLPRLQARGSRVLIFSQMTRLLDILEDFCCIRNYDYCRIDGSSSYEHREDAIESFNAPSSKKFVFLLSSRAGGLGINLATADIVILYDSDWNPQVDLQAQDRAHRIGQTKPVQVYRLITQDTVEEKVVERAMMKLKLDAVVVQQGRLADKSKSLQKDEMLAMIQYGADTVFRQTHEDDMTDEDIDALLRTGEEKTEEMTKKIDDSLPKDADSLMQFKLDGGSSQVFEGVDYSKEANRKKAEAEKLQKLKEFVTDLSDAMGRRQRRAVATYSDATHSHKSYSAWLSHLSRHPKMKQLPRMDPWQFYDRKRIQELKQQEEAHYQREIRKVQESLHRINYKRHQLGLDGTGVGGTITAQAMADFDEQPYEAEQFDVDKIAEREQLLTEGFRAWRRKDFLAFVEASRRYGRYDLLRISEAIPTKTFEEVEEYAKVFWEKGPTHLEHWGKIEGSIVKAQAKMLEIHRLEAAVAAKIAACPANSNPWESLKWGIAIPRNATPYTEENDRFLLCLVAELGYGRWRETRDRILRSSRFTMDYFFRSRSTAELRQRTEMLMKMIERDIMTDFRGKHAAKQREEQLQKQLEATAQRRADMHALLQRSKAKRAKAEAALKQMSITAFGATVDAAGGRDAATGPPGKMTVPEDRVRDLVMLLSARGHMKVGDLVDEFKQRCPDASKAQIQAKIKELAQYDKRSGQWHIRQQFQHLVPQRPVGQVQGAEQAMPTNPGADMWTALMMQLTQQQQQQQQQSNQAGLEAWMRSTDQALRAAGQTVGGLPRDGSAGGGSNETLLPRMFADGPLLEGQQLDVTLSLVKGGGICRKSDLIQAIMLQCDLMRIPRPAKKTVERTLSTVAQRLSPAGGVHPNGIWVPKEEFQPYAQTLPMVDVPTVLAGGGTQVMSGLTPQQIAGLAQLMTSMGQHGMQNAEAAADLSHRQQLAFTSQVAALGMTPPNWMAGGMAAASSYMGHGMSNQSSHTGGSGSAESTSWAPPQPRERSLVPTSTTTTTASAQHSTPEKRKSSEGQLRSVAEIKRQVASSSSAHTPGGGSSSTTANRPTEKPRVQGSMDAWLARATKKEGNSGSK